MTTGSSIAEHVRDVMFGISNEIARRVRETPGSPEDWRDEAFVARVVREHVRAVMDDYTSGRWDPNPQVNARPKGTPLQ